MGDRVNQQVKERMKELGDAINKTWSASVHIPEVVSHIKEDGYDIRLVLEATIGVKKKGEKRWEDLVVPVTARSELYSTSWPAFWTVKLRRWRWIGKTVRVGPTRPDGTPHPSAGKTGRVLDVLPLGTHGAQTRAMVEVENDFILVSLETLEVLQQSANSQ